MKLFMPASHDSKVLRSPAHNVPHSRRGLIDHFEPAHGAEMPCRRATDMLQHITQTTCERQGEIVRGSDRSAPRELESTKENAGVG